MMMMIIIIINENVYSAVCTRSTLDIDVEQLVDFITNLPISCRSL